jgi:predicted nucleic acid-binding Zn ribbon protein
MPMSFTSLISPCKHCIIPFTRKSVSTVQKDILREERHKLTFATTNYYNYSILLLIVVNLLQCLIYKLNFIIDICA